MTTLYTLTCDSCGGRFEATRADAVTCGSTCRQRRHREQIAARAATAAAALLHRQTAAVVGLTAPGVTDADRAHYRRELDAIAAEAERVLPRAA
ncbi:hypothetical protein [Microbacterium sp. R86528]|uniref:hypothetical protein n=1 Tax=Microbacterium sp. R86528 TaxID=3093864 RepID=UPI0037CC4D37